MKSATRAVAAWCVGLAALGWPSKASAIPAFARLYNTTCARCHSEVPRLNNYGWNFKLNGYHVPGDEGVGTVPTPEDKRLSLLKMVPLAVRLQGFLRVPSSGRTSETLDSELDLLMAGHLAPRIGFWAEVDTAKNPDGSYSTDIGNVRAIFTNLMHGRPRALNLEVGKFNMDEFGISTGRILTQNPYAIYSVGDALGNYPESDEVTGLNVFGAFGTGIGKAVPASEQKAGQAAAVSTAEEKAVEAQLQALSAAPPPESPQMIATRAVLDALVEKGILTAQEAADIEAKLAGQLPAPPPAQPTEAAPPPGPVTVAKSDYDVRKGLFYQAGLVTRGDPGGSDPQGFGRLIYSNAQGWWLGPTAYFGSNTISPGGTLPASSFNDNFHRYGLEAGFTTGPQRNVAGVSRRAIEVYLAYQRGLDTNTDGAGLRARHAGGFAEATYLFDDQDLAVLRWDRLTSHAVPFIDVNTLTVNYTRYLRRNLKVGIEYMPDFLSNSASHIHTSTWTMFYDFTF